MDVPTELRPRLGSPPLVGLVAVILALAFQALTVHYNYGNNWTALFCVGDRFVQPHELQKPYQFPNSWGYDGQGYRLIAHDPFAQRGFDRFLDDPRYRYSRILVPLTAWTLALGNDRWIDAAYITAILGFVFAGATWLAMFARQNRFPAIFGLLFLLAPATLVALDRLTIDVALAALCVAFVILKPGSVSWLTALAAAALCRETGLLLIAAACVTFLLKREIKKAIITALTAVPALAWLVNVANQLPASSSASRISPIPLAGYLGRVAHPFSYEFPPLINAITQTLDYTALAAVAIALYCLIKLRTKPELWACAIPVIFVSLPDVWSEVYAFGRTMTPFWLLIALRGTESRLWIALAPIALMDVRIGWQLGPQILGIIKGLVT